MPGYVVLFPADDEAAWAAGSEADHQVTYDADAEFVRRLKQRGGTVTGGAELAPSSRTRTLPESRRATQGLSGFLMVTCDSEDALVEAARVLVPAHPVVEIRPTVEG